MLQAAGETSAEQPNNQAPAELARALVAAIQPEVVDRRITVRLDGKTTNRTVLNLLAVASKSFEHDYRRHRNSHRFKQILLAMHNHHDVFKSFPTADKYRDKDGNPLLSWRVHILPFVQQAKLYRQFRLDEPWDSPHNKPLLEEMPDVFTSDAVGIPPDARIQPGYTTFQAPVGEGTAFGQDKACKFRDFRDGTSNTVVLVEVKPRKAVPWTAPDDYQFDPKDPSAGLLMGPDGRWLAGFADGSVQQLRGDLSAELLLRLFRISDGQVVDHREIK